MAINPTLVKSIYPALLFAAAAGFSSSAVKAQGVDLTSGFTDFTTWSLFGSATATNNTPGNGFTYSNIALTKPETGDSAGAGFAPEAIILDFNQSFTFWFNFFIAPGGIARGDGFTFTLAGTPGVGGGGSDLGFGGLGSDTVAFAVDTFNFPGEPASPSLQILQGGSVAPLAATETGLGDAIRDLDYQWFATVNFTPSGNDDEKGVLKGIISHFNLGTFEVSADVDLSTVGLIVNGGHSVYFGFTGANGVADDGHFITSAQQVPVPLPAAVWLFGTAVSAIGCLVRRTKR